MASRPIIKELILENFMSYEYGRIPLEEGLNVIAGPNGAGKSTILVAISLVMGQLYTERSKKLSDLVRRGSGMARITLMLDNRALDGKRPFPFQKDEVMLSRYIRKDGSYWFEIDYHEMSRVEVVELLKRVGINSDNYLIIMPQGVIDEFILIKPDQKLKMMEEALGILSIRENLHDARVRLAKILSDEEQYQSLLERAVETMGRWKEEYDKLVRAKELKKELESLNGELAWSSVAKAEKALESLKEKLRLAQEEKESLEKSLASALAVFNEINDGLDRNIGLAQDMAIKVYDGKGGERKDLVDLQNMLGGLKGSVQKLVEAYGEVTVLRYRVRLLEREVKQLDALIKASAEELGASEDEARKGSPRPKSVRTQTEVEDGIRLVNAELKVLGEVNQEAEKVYMEFRDKIDQYKDRLAEVRRNKEMTQKEIVERANSWRITIKEIMDKVNKRFSEIMATIGAAGMVMLINDQDPEAAGLNILTNFSGGGMVALDSFSESGGELSASVTAFLLAVQNYILSPFRALDEFDVHMDPVIRGRFFKSIYNMFKNDVGVQYVVITPALFSFYDQSINYIMVQKAAIGSQAKVVKVEGKE